MARMKARMSGSMPNGVASRMPKTSVARGEYRKIGMARMNATMKRLRMSRTIASMVIPPPWPMPWAIWAISPCTGAPVLGAAFAWPAWASGGAAAGAWAGAGIVWPACASGGAAASTWAGAGIVWPACASGGAAVVPLATVLPMTADCSSRHRLHGTISPPQLQPNRSISRRTSSGVTLASSYRTVTVWDTGFASAALTPGWRRRNSWSPAAVLARSRPRASKTFRVTACLHRRRPE